MFASFNLIDPSRPARAALVTALLAAWLLPSTARGEGDATDRADATALSAIKKLGAVVRTIPVASDGGGTAREIEFHLRGRKLNDTGLAHVAALKNVAALNLRDTKISSAGLVHLKDLKTLRWLHLERTQIGDEGTEHLSGLVNLEYLNLYGTKITDKSLAHLAGLKKLRRLYVWRTGVTDAGVARLEKKLPKLQVVRGVDLSEFPEFSIESDVPEPTEDLKWIAASRKDDAPKSRNGLNTVVFFENKFGQAVKLYWVSYGGELKLYAQLEPGTTRQQNSYSKNCWLITDLSENALGYFIIGEEVGRAIIPAPEGKKK